MTFSIETTQGTFKATISTTQGGSFGTEYHSTIKQGNKVAAQVIDYRQVGMGFVPSTLNGLSELQAVAIHKAAVAMFKAQ